jgi:hypothetical protein
MKILEELELKALYAPGYFYLAELYSENDRPEAALDPSIKPLITL